jgi:iron-chelate-transporting ATPase
MTSSELSTATLPMAAAPAGKVPLFVLGDVRFSLAGIDLLKSTSLILPVGKIIGLVGHNGSGKSTLLKLLARQLPVSSGTLRFSGRPIGNWSSRAFARKVG